MKNSTTKLKNLLTLPNDKRVKISTFRKELIAISKELSMAKEKLYVRQKYDNFIKHWPSKELLKELFVRFRKWVGL